MQKDQSYHESAIAYNDAIAEAAEAQAESDKVVHPEVKKWCRSVGKQHRFHSKRHRSALDKLQKANNEVILEAEEMPLHSHDPSKDGKTDLELSLEGQLNDGKGI